MTIRQPNARDAGGEWPRTARAGYAHDLDQDRASPRAGQAAVATDKAESTSEEYSPYARAAGEKPVRTAAGNQAGRVNGGMCRPSRARGDGRSRRARVLPCFARGTFAAAIAERAGPLSAARSATVPRPPVGPASATPAPVRRRPAPARRPDAAVGQRRRRRMPRDRPIKQRRPPPVRRATALGRGVNRVRGQARRVLLGQRSDASPPTAGQSTCGRPVYEADCCRWPGPTARYRRPSLLSD